MGVADTNDVIQKIEKTLNNTHTTTQKLTNNSFRNTKKHPRESSLQSQARSKVGVWLACVAWRFWLGALSNKGWRGQRNREEIGAERKLEGFVWETQLLLPSHA